MEEIMQEINNIANQFIELLRASRLMPPLRMIGAGIIPHDGALYKNIARFGDDRPKVEICRYEIAGQPVLWVGFGTGENDPMLTRLCNDCRPEFSNAELNWHDTEALENCNGQPIVVRYDEYGGFGVIWRWQEINFQASVVFIERVLQSLLDFREMERERDSEEIKHDRNLDRTEKEALIKARIGQGQFRERSEDFWNYQCAVLGCSTPQVLRASHIKSWSESNNQERLDPNNGLLLAAHLDALFDRGLISFSDDGRMLISNKIVEADRIQLSLGGNLRIPPSPEMQGYLRYHRQRHNFEAGPV